MKKNSEQNENYQEIDLLDYVNVLAKRWKKIVRNVVAVMFLIAVISFLLPKSYTAITTILPPEKSKSNGLLTALSNSPLSNLLLAESGTTSDLFVEILRSRSVLDGVLQEKFLYRRNQKKPKSKSLLQILNLSSLEKGRKKLIKKVNIVASQEGIIHVKVELNDPCLAADVANAFVRQLDKTNKEKTTSRAKNSRIYIENQLKLTDEKLSQASNLLVKFKEKYKAVSLQAQTEAAIEEAGEVKGRIIVKQVELGVALQTMKPDNVVIIKLKREIEELQKQYDYLQYGNDEKLENQKEFYIPFAEVPGVGLELAKLMRDVKVQETVWELLNQQYYHAKIQEARDTPTIQVLDEAVSPETRTKPKRKILVLVGGFLAFIFSIFFAFTAEFFERLKSDATSSRKTDEIVGNLKKDWDGIKKHISSILKKDGL